MDSFSKFIIIFCIVNNTFYYKSIKSIIRLTYRL